MTNEHSRGSVPRRRMHDLDTASRLWNRPKYEWDNVASRPKAEEGLLESYIKEKLGMRSDNTRTNTNNRAKQQAQVKARKMSDIAAERAVGERRNRAKYDAAHGKGTYNAKKAQERTKVQVAKANQEDKVGLAARYAADAIDGGMLGASMIPGYGQLMGTAYFGAKGAKDLSQGDYLSGTLNLTPYGAVVGKAAMPYAARAYKAATAPLYRFGSTLNDESKALTTVGDVIRHSKLNGKPVWNITEENLPDYANVYAGMTGDPVAFHIQRLRDGGFDNLPWFDASGKTSYTGKINRFNYSIPYKTFNRNIYTFNYDKNPTATINAHARDIEDAFHLSNYPRIVSKNNLVNQNASPYFAMPSTGHVYIRKNGVNTATKLFNGRAPSIFKSHEMDHAVHIPTEPAKGFDFSNLPDGLRTYFTDKNNTDIAARGSQIKDFFGLKKGNDEITEDMLKFASDNYTKYTGVDNNMTDFFNSITDWKEAAKWLSKYATAFSAPVGLTYGTYTKQGKNNNVK